MNDTPLKIKFTAVDDICVVDISGRLDTGSADEFKSRVSNHLYSNCKKIILDMSGVVFVNSSGLGALVVFYKEKHSEGVEVCICGARKNIRQIFEMVKFDRIFKIFDTLEDVVANYS